MRTQGFAPIGPPWSDLVGISCYWCNILEAVPAELWPCKPGLGQGVLACPPRPETGTGSGGATGLEYAVVVVIFRRGIYGTVALQARSGAGSHGVMG